MLVARGCCRASFRWCCAVVENGEVGGLAKKRVAGTPRENETRFGGQLKSCRLQMNDALKTLVASSDSIFEESPAVHPRTVAVKRVFLGRDLGRGVVVVVHRCPTVTGAHPPHQQAAPNFRLRRLTVSRGQLSYDRLAIGLKSCKRLIGNHNRMSMAPIAVALSS